MKVNVFFSTFHKAWNIFFVPIRLQHIVFVRKNDKKTRDIKKFCVDDRNVSLLKLLSCKKSLR